MSDEQKQQETSPTVAMFQKAHAALVTLQRIDEQIAQLADRRRKTQGELREAQSQLNEEIDRAAAAPDAETLRISGQRRPRLGGDSAIAEAA